MTKTTKLEEASRRWGGAAVHTASSSAPVVPAPAGRGLAVSFQVGPARVSRVTEQIRSIDGNKLDRSPTR